MCCVLPTVGVIVLSIFAVITGNRILNEFATPDSTRMQQTFAKLQAKNPNATPDELVKKIISRQSWRCGLLGAITGVGGLVTIPIALPIDMITSLRIQTAMVNFIALAYNVKPDQMESQVINVVVMSGGRQASEYVTQRVTTRLIARLSARVAGKSLVKLVPFVGAIVGFMFNYILTQATGRAAMQYYRNIGQVALPNNQRPQLNG